MQCHGITLRCLCFIAPSEQFPNLQFASATSGDTNGSELPSFECGGMRCDRLSSCRIVLTALSDMIQLAPDALQRYPQLVRLGFTASLIRRPENWTFFSKPMIRHVRTLICHDRQCLKITQTRRAYHTKAKHVSMWDALPATVTVVVKAGITSRNAYATS
jgi:hypothetical protein